MKLEGLKAGTRLVVRNGAKGEQVAVVASVNLDKQAGVHTARVHKWLARGQRWTARVTVWPGEVLRYASAEDFRKRRVKSMAPVG